MSASTGRESPFSFSFSTRFHVVAAELWGKIAGRALVKTARHADAVGDYVTVLRVREIVRRGYAVGWSEDAFDNGDVIPNRGRDEALNALELAE